MHSRPHDAHGHSIVRTLSVINRILKPTCDSCSINHQSHQGKPLHAITPCSPRFISPSSYIHCTLQVLARPPQETNPVSGYQNAFLGNSETMGRHYNRFAGHLPSLLVPLHRHRSAVPRILVRSRIVMCFGWSHQQCMLPRRYRKLGRRKQVSLRRRRGLHRHTRLGSTCIQTQTASCSRAGCPQLSMYGDRDLCDLPSRVIHHPRTQQSNTTTSPPTSSSSNLRPSRETLFHKPCNTSKSEYSLIVFVALLKCLRRVR